ncbi:MAG: chorismate-binding protein [Cytophagales bacterium]|nr:chorismate-binding protein [Cytophagales bacterium]MDW8383686.1 chorismate-binding protein [Flammeovirgaceae bacterium]
MKEAQVIQRTFALSHRALLECQQRRWGTVLWHLPNSQKIFWFTDLQGGTLVNPVLEEIGAGFLIQPFEKNDRALLLKPDIIASSLWQGIEQTPLFEIEKGQIFLEAFQKEPFFSYSLNRIDFKSSLDEESFFEDIVEKAVQQISCGRMQKVVLSRKRYQPYSNSLDLAKLFIELCKAYPNAFVVLCFTPQHGWWIGASPEILISIDSKGIFRTVALAGTQPKSLDDIRQATWRQKEIEEQALVSRYIVNCFKKIRLREFEEVGPRTVEVGNLIHLRTDFIVDTRAVNFPELGSVMLELLHPTSAVCGMPKEQALTFIHQYENYSRNLYSGYWGIVNFEQETHLFVNLRCAELLEKGAYLYAGAGITQDSIPQKEFEETQIKMNVIGRFL